MRKLLVACVVCLSFSICKAEENSKTLAKAEFDKLVNEQEQKYDTEYWEKRRLSKAIASQNLEQAVYQFVIDELIQACEGMTGDTHGSIYLKSVRFGKRMIINKCNIENIGE